MENIDERDIDAARFEKQVFEIFRDTEIVRSAAVQKLVIFLLFTELTAKRLQLPWTWDDTETLRGLIKAKSHAVTWLKLRNYDGEQDAWGRLSPRALHELRHLVSDNSNSKTSLKRLDFFVQKLEALGHANAWQRRVESFVADFTQGWSVHNRTVVDLNTMTTGEIGIRLDHHEAANDYMLPSDISPHLFEICLRLHAHNVQFYFSEEHRTDSLWSTVGTAYKFAWPARNHPQQDPYQQKNPLSLRGLEFALWFQHYGHGPRVMIVVLPTADLRAKGLRADARRDLLNNSRVLGVVVIPARVCGSARLSMVIMAVGQHSLNEPILLMNGRAVDGLRDEPLDRLAQFLSIPFMNAMMPYGTGKESQDKKIGSALSNRARKMYGNKFHEVPGFFRHVPVEEILNDSHAILDPLQWISERDPMVASDLLDGSPVYTLLEEREQPYCIYIIGNNGAGKSMLLRQLATACVSSGRPVRAIASAASDRFETKMSPTVDYLYLGARTNKNSTQPRKLGRKLAELMIAIYADQKKITAVNAVLAQLSFAGQHYLLPEAAVSDVLESVRELGVDGTPTNINGWKLGFRKNHENSIIPFDHLSTGEQQLLLLTARLVEHARPGVVFLIDEPETSLHVAWQRALPSVFQTISQNFTCQIVIATHSPILISTSRGSDTMRFMADGGVLEIIEEQAASSVERVLFQGFDTYTGNNREVHERCAELVSRAIELANTERTEMLPRVLEELTQMQETVARSVPALGAEVPALHLDLIRRAKLAIAELTRPNESTGDKS
ncbi:AAA family ATPase [Alcaligenes phenolicus]|uniref:AAA family ATPase n=1 Tax=Alcaligenes phenolicus TaxID=232846 RepID=A0ABV2BJP0_9BURK